MRARALALLLPALAALPSGCQRPRPWSARIVLTLGSTDGRPVHGIDVTLALPAGARIASEEATGRISAGALAEGTGAPDATIDGRFVAHPSAPYARLLVASRQPLRDGELAAIAATVLSAVTPPLERFEVVRVRISGPGGAPVPGASVWVSAVELR